MTLYQNEFPQFKPYVAEFPYRTIVKRDLVQLRNNPHPTRVKHVKGFLGQPTQSVDTDEDEAVITSASVESYIKDSMKRGSWNYKNDANKFIKKSKDLDEILALQYFTGLQSFSFKENYLPYLGYREYFNDWRKQLRILTENTYQPIMGQIKGKEYPSSAILQHPIEWLNNGEENRAKSMYSSSGRLSTCSGNERNLTARQRIRSQQRMSTSLSVRNNKQDIKSPVDYNNMDASVFVLLATFLQTKSAHVVQNWLSQATEREKALMISMVQSALLNQNFDKVEYYDTSTEKGTQTMKYSMTPLKEEEGRTCSSNNDVHGNGQSDILIVDNVTDNDVTKNVTDVVRPPTSSTFRPEKVCRTNTTASKRESNVSMWNPNISIDLSHQKSIGLE